jgi:cytochrome P450
MTSWAPRFPVIGSLLHLRFSRSDFLLETSRSLGDSYWLDLGVDRVLVVGHPEDAARVLDNHDGAYADKGGNTGFRRISVPFLGGGLSTWNAMDTEWRRRRSAFSRLYRTTQPTGFDLHDLTSVDGDGRRLAIERAIVADVIAKLLMVAPPIAEIVAVTDLLRQLAGTFWSTKAPGPHPFVGAKVRRATAALELIVQSWIESSHDDSPIRHHMGDLSDAQVRDEVLSQLLSVGTLAVPAEWAFHLLAASPSVQDALRSSLAHSNDDYLSWVARETLRLCPSTYWIQRRVCSDDELSGTPVSMGDRVLIHVPSVHRHPDFWTEPDSFRPERFGGPSDWRRAWMPFGRGARLCVAHGYSLNVIKSIIARVVTGNVIAAKPQRAAVLVTGFSLIPRPNPSLIFTRV